VYLYSRKEGFGEEVKRRIMLGTYALSAGYYEAYYLKAQKIRTLIKQDFDRAFEKNDFILTPTSPSIPFKLGKKTEDPLQMYLSDILTVPVSLAGIPALSLPIGKAQKLPTGLQIIGKSFQEMEILNFAKELEKFCFW
jgi:aspartyl-tRNA(Asn)/glutamyl-tRNA(Gln) amidotransferase subunit A